MDREIELHCDLDQRLVPRSGEPHHLPLGASAGSLPAHADLPHPRDSLQGVLQVLLTDVHREA